MIYCNNDDGDDDDNDDNDDVDHTAVITNAAANSDVTNRKTVSLISVCSLMPYLF